MVYFLIAGGLYLIIFLIVGGLYSDIQNFVLGMFLFLRIFDCGFTPLAQEKSQTQLAGLFLIKSGDLHHTKAQLFVSVNTYASKSETVHQKAQLFICNRCENLVIST